MPEEEIHELPASRFKSNSWQALDTGKILLVGNAQERLINATTTRVNS
jgi:hypothetical protein